MTFDWYCTGSPGSGNNFCADGTFDLSGYAGMGDVFGAYPLGDGLCQVMQTLQATFYLLLITILQFVCIGIRRR